MSVATCKPFSEMGGRVLNVRKPVNARIAKALALKLWWKSFGGSGGNFIHDLMRTYNGTMTGGMKRTGVRGRFGGYGAFLHDGTNDEAAVTFPFISPPFTLDCWVHPNTGSGDAYYPFMSRGGVFVNDTNFAFGVRNPGAAATNAVHCYWRNGGTLHGGETAANAFTWDTDGKRWNRFVAIVFANFDLHIYVNGTLSLSDTNSAGPTDGSQSFKLGGPSSTAGGDRYFPGYLNSARIYTKALSARELRWVRYDDMRGNPKMLNWLHDETHLPEEVVAAQARFLLLLGAGT